MLVVIWMNDSIALNLIGYICLTQSKISRSVWDFRIVLNSKQSLWFKKKRFKSKFPKKSTLFSPLNILFSRFNKNNKSWNSDLQMKLNTHTQWIGKCLCLLFWSGNFCFSLPYKITRLSSCFCALELRERRWKRNKQTLCSAIKIK